MQIARHLLLACAVATYLTPTLAHAYDNESQIRARQALEEKMNQLQTQAPETNSAPPTAVTPEAQPKPKRAKKAKPAAPKPEAPVVNVTPANTNVETPSAQPAPAASAEDEKLREALHQKMSEQPAVSATTNEAPKHAPKPKRRAENPAPPVVNAAPSKPAMENPPMQPAPAAAMPEQAPSTPAVSADDEKLREALHQKMLEQQAISTTTNESPAPAVQSKKTKKAPPVVAKTPSVQEQNQTPVTPAPAQAPSAAYSPLPAPSNVQRPTLPAMPAPAPAPTAKNPAQPTMTLPPLSGPPSSLSAAKQQKLDALLEQYRNDQITPQQYHEQRAKILAEP